MLSSTSLQTSTEVCVRCGQMAHKREIAVFNRPIALLARREEKTPVAAIVESLTTAPCQHDWKLVSNRSSWSRTMQGPAIRVAENVYSNYVIQFLKCAAEQSESEFAAWLAKVLSLENLDAFEYALRAAGFDRVMGGDTNCNEWWKGDKAADIDDYLDRRVVP